MVNSNFAAGQRHFVRYNNYNTQMAQMPQQYQQPQVVNTGVQDEVVFSNNNNKCTDGKDDGKIGFWSAAGNFAEGVGKTFYNGLKGMVTDSEGKFSLGKTIASAAAAGVCIAFPAVGLVACAAGGVMGAVQVGKGVYTAATADTDAEAKQAWENIGGGTFTVATSAAGAKASLNAVTKTSTAANGLSSLGKDASLGAKVKALGADMVSSTVNRGKAIGQTAQALHSKHQFDTANSHLKKAKIGSEEWNKYQPKAAKAADKYYSFDAATRESVRNIQNAPRAALNAGQSAWQAIKGVKLSDVSAQLQQLGPNAVNIFNTLKSGGYNAAIKQFGASEVGQVIQLVGGYAYANQSI